ncbi:MAG: DUF3078 domain-containing protein [Bacteroidaceae bacterium]|nr:DUF3078 domain-containing protein [Bacteroidaceae bacterium]MBO7111845.1 DUF3078 domain-containing protein [Bacteroidaceae bacterium]
MKKTVLILAAMLPLSLCAQEEEGWNHNGLTGITFSQTSFTNWSEGGENTIADNVYLNASLNYKKDKLSWTNDLKINYGQNYTDNNGWRKNLDNIDFASKLGHQITDKLYYAALLDFKSQLFYGYKYTDNDKELTSKGFTPAYLNVSVGLDYKPNDNIAIYYSPVAGKLTMVADSTFAVRYGIDANKYVKPQLGSYLKINANYKLLEDRLTIKSVLDLFTAYDDTFGNIDVNWDVLIGYNLTKLLTLTFQSTLKYDDDIKTFETDANGKTITHGAKVQFKEMVGIGLSYNF